VGHRRRDPVGRPRGWRGVHSPPHARPSPVRAPGSSAGSARSVHTMPPDHKSGRRLGGCLWPVPRSSRIRPANDRETSRNDGNSRATNADVRRQIRASSQVAREAPRTLSRWRHGFKSRWDYFQGPLTSASRCPWPGRSLSRLPREPHLPDARPDHASRLACLRAL